jgi:hypothetical protein
LDGWEMGWDAGGVEELPGASGTKKDGTNGLAVRAGRPVTQLTSSSGAVVRPVPSLEYIHHSIDWGGVKYKNRNLYLGSEKSSFASLKHLNREMYCPSKFPAIDDREHSSKQRS